MSRREKLEKLVEKDASDPFLHFGLAMELVKEGRVDDAVASFDRCISHDPHYTAAFYHKGRTLLEAGRRDEARATLQLGTQAARAIGNAHALSEMEELLAGA